MKTQTVVGVIKNNKTEIIIKIKGAIIIRTKVEIDSLTRKDNKISTGNLSKWIIKILHKLIPWTNGTMVALNCFKKRKRKRSKTIKFKLPITLKTNPTSTKKLDNKTIKQMTQTFKIKKPKNLGMTDRLFMGLQQIIKTMTRTQTIGFTEILTAKNNYLILN